MADSIVPSTSIREFITSLQRDWSFDEWFAWPPDVFALTSLLLKNTGAYRYCVAPPGGLLWPERDDWQQVVEDDAQDWWKWILGERQTKPRLLRRNWERLQKSLDLTIDRIRVIERNGRVDEEAWEACRALLELHGLADQASVGFGLPAGNKYKTGSDGLVAARFLGNLLLSSTGTLSRLPKHRALVLPKMRTPQVGLTLRSLSHHLTLHETEVEVVWRTVPWINTDEDTINIMVVPWPYRIDATWFSPEHHSVNRESPEPTRYFSFAGQSKAQPVDAVVSMLKNSQSLVNRIHVLAFPELALTLDELFHLKNRLASELERDRIPMVISGIRKSSSSPKNGLGINKVVLSTFFGGKWYDLFQDKHHRWKLDVSQIRQYDLGGVLSASRSWWEAIAIPERRITFMAPNGWLTLCPLICEDLARFEPVSELIRGVGPTLLIAILLDGPQLKERWSSRYASVLADDPGTSVLTVSSLGMAKRSAPPAGERKSNVIALWRDQETGSREIEIGDEHGAAIITIAATWKKELAADGRDDNGNAAAFILQGVRPLGLPNQHETSRLNTRYAHSEVLDTEELTIFTYLVDAAIDVSDEMIDTFHNWTTGGDNQAVDWCDSQGNKLKSIRDLIRNSTEIQYRSKSIKQYTSKGESHDKIREVDAFVEWFCSFLKSVRQREQQSNGNNQTTYWESLVNSAEEILTNVAAHKYFDYSDDRVILERLALRVQIYSGLAILWAIHKRLSSKRRISGLTHQSERLLDRIENLISKEYDNAWYEPSPTSFIRRDLRE